MERILLLIFVFTGFFSADAQVVLERDINEEPASSEPTTFAELDGVLYFRADDGVHGEELYQYDISTETASLVANLKPFDENAGILEVVAFDGKIYFIGRNGTSSRLYIQVYDPLSGITERLTDAEGETVQDPGDLFVFDGDLYFSADFGSDGQELGRYDPESDEVEMVANIAPGDENSDPWSFVEINGELWFLAKAADFTPNKLWRFNSDTNSLEEIVYTSESGLFPNLGRLHLFDNKLFFRGNIQGMGTELWIYDIAQNTLLDFPEVYPGAGSSTPALFTNFNGKLYFTARDVTYQRELRVYDPVTETVSLVVDIYDGSNSNPGEIFPIGDKLYFTASVDEAERRLFSYDPANEILTEEAFMDNGGFNNFLSSLYATDETLYLTGLNPIVGQELLSFTPGADEIEVAADINTTTIGSDPYQFTEYNGKLYFGADEINSGREIWVYNPATGNVDILSDFPGSTSPNGFTVLDGKLYFSGIDPDEGYGLLYYDEATGEINPTSFITPNNTGHITDITAYDGLLYFKAFDETVGDEVHVFNPSNNTVEILMDIYPGGEDSNPEKFFVFNNELFFQANDGVSGNELWRYNSSTDIVEMVADINPGEDDSSPTNFAEYDGKLFFSAFENSTSYELYSFDPITETVTRHTDVSGGMDPNYLTVYKGKLFFEGKYSSSINVELLSYDAIEDTLVLEADLVEGGGAGSPRDLVVFNDKLYFTANTDEYGRELWEYNDTTPVIVADIRPGVPSSDPTDLTLFNGKLYFSANDGTKGAEIWSIAECLNVFVDTEPNMGSNQGGAIDLTINGGLPPYTITWSNGAITEDIDDLEPGVYTATVSDASGCLSEISAEITFVSSTDDLLDANVVRLFPNPATNWLMVESDNVEIQRIELFTLSGNSIYSDFNHLSAFQWNLDLTSHQPGMYIVKVQTEKGVVAKKILVL